jgi:IS5 family transposase
MFKVLFLQRYYGLSDHQIEYQIVDRTSFRKFLGIECVDDVPDEKTVWKYRELLTNTGVYDKLFSEFHSFMESKGLQFNEGRIIDASFVIAPRQRNTRDENEQIKQGAGDKLWNDNPHKKCHKDVDARWTKKRDETFFTATSSILKLRNAIRSYFLYDTTSAEVHDSKGFEGLLDEKRRRQGLVFGRRLCRTRGDCKTA